jgi:hypothetical protein
MKHRSNITTGLRTALLGLLLPILTACSENSDYETAICALVDISGTYADEKSNVARLIKAGILPEMISGDSLFFISIDSNSFSEDNLKQKVKLDYRPSYANQQKLEFATSLDKFASGMERSSYTDISGAMMLCSDYLKSSDARTQMMFIFSDMQEDLQEGIARIFEDDEFTNMHIAAMNVIRLARDSNDPRVFRDRLRDWEKKVSRAGASNWEVILEPSQIPVFIEEAK